MHPDCTLKLKRMMMQMKTKTRRKTRRKKRRLLGLLGLL
jgi:hypothetical protein